MIHAYQKIYLSKSQQVLGDAFDYAINFCHIPGDDFIKLFLVSSISKKIEEGDVNYILGKSGIDIVLEIVKETTGKVIEAKSIESINRSKEYWIGWAIGYYQWYSDRKFFEIFQAISFNDLENMYYTLHEADISKFVEIINQRIKDVFPETKLKHFRLISECSQLELSKKSGVSLRSIQMYEQRNKDINKASVETLYRLSKVFGCSIEDLMEK